MPDNIATTKLLKLAKSGDENALAELFPLVYDELRRLAAARMKNEPSNHTLQPTALVHEVYLRLIDQHSVDWANRAHFFGLAAEMMRRILVTHAVAKKADKRGGDFIRIELNEDISLRSVSDVDFIDLDKALAELAEFAPRQARVVELRFFGGLTNEEVASILDLDERTIKRDWRTARAWLFGRLGPNETPD